LALDALNVWTTSEREDYDAHPRRCFFASVRPGWSARTCCNVAIAGTEWSSRASRHAWSPTLVHSPSRRRSRVHRCARFGLANRRRAPGARDGRRDPVVRSHRLVPEFRPLAIVREFPCGGAQHRPRSPVGQTGDHEDH
jgi:hypothetical protein